MRAKRPHTDSRVARKRPVSLGRFGMSSVNTPSPNRAITFSRALRALRRGVAARARCSVAGHVARATYQLQRSDADLTGAAAVWRQGPLRPLPSHNRLQLGCESGLPREQRRFGRHSSSLKDLVHLCTSPAVAPVAAFLRRSPPGEPVVLYHRRCRGRDEKQQVLLLHCTCCLVISR